MFNFFFRCALCQPGAPTAMRGCKVEQKCVSAGLCEVESVTQNVPKQNSVPSNPPPKSHFSSSKLSECCSQSTDTYHWYLSEHCRDNVHLFTPSLSSCHSCPAFLGLTADRPISFSLSLAIVLIILAQHFLELSFPFLISSWHLPNEDNAFFPG